MTSLRQQMIEEMKFKRLSQNTQEAYIYAVKGIAKYYNKSPDKLNIEQIKEYLVYLLEVKKRSWNTCNVALAGIIFF